MQHLHYLADCEKKTMKLSLYIYIKIEWLKVHLPIYTQKHETLNGLNQNTCYHT